MEDRSNHIRLISISLLKTMFSLGVLVRNLNGSIAYSALCSQLYDNLYGNSLILFLVRSGKALLNKLEIFPALGYMNRLCIFSSSSFVKLHVITFSFCLIYVLPFRNISGNSHCLLELYNLLFVKSICIYNRLKASTPVRNGTLIGTTFIWNSMNNSFRRGSLVVNVPRLI